ncbi:unnamed protein product [Orchesella dallaii]|uniref:Uncharacterized protein n=1 Tax=Orchesella dallaii TaxID=48710 RepID=A0ABP1QWT7_9HEXA
MHNIFLRETRTKICVSSIFLSVSIEYIKNVLKDKQKERKRETTQSSRNKGARRKLNKTSVNCSPGWRNIIHRDIIYNIKERSRDSPLYSSQSRSFLSSLCF